MCCITLHTHAAARQFWANIEFKIDARSQSVSDFISFPTNKAELEAGIHQFWALKMDIAQCRRYITHIIKMSPVVIAAKGFEINR